MIHTIAVGAHFTFANLAAASLDAAIFAGAHLDSAQLLKVSAVGTDFRSASLAFASFANADLRKARFEDAWIKDTNFDGAQLEGATFDARTRLPFSEEVALSRGMVKTEGDWTLAFPYRKERDWGTYTEWGERGNAHFDDSLGICVDNDDGTPSANSDWWGNAVQW